MRIKIISDNVKGLKTKFYISLIFPIVSPPCKPPGGGALYRRPPESISLSQTIQLYVQTNISKARLDTIISTIVCWTGLMFHMTSRPVNFTTCLKWLKLSSSLTQHFITESFCRQQKKENIAGLSPSCSTSRSSSVCITIGKIPSKY